MGVENLISTIAWLVDGPLREEEWMCRGKLPFPAAMKG
jgi:hypothetical protein